MFSTAMKLRGKRAREIAHRALAELQGVWAPGALVSEGLTRVQAPPHHTLGRWLGRLEPPIPRL